MITLRAARSTDAGKIGAILSAFAQDTDWMPIMHTGAEDIAHAGQMIDRGWVTVAEDSTAVCGFMALDGTDLDALYIAAGAQRKGIGSALIEAAKSGAETLELWTFDANLPARQFYLKHGFKEIQRSDGSSNDEKLPDIRFQWQKGQM